MSRLMSVSLTEQAVVDRRKTVTRRLGWTFIKPGERLTLCRKVMGRKPGEPLVRLAEVEVVSVRRERLSAITPLDVKAEAVPGMEKAAPYQWARWYADKMGMGGNIDGWVTRIEWRYVGEAAA